MAYVVSLKVARRVRKDFVEDGRYSDPGAGGADMLTDADEDERPSPNGNAFRVRVTVRESMAARCGAVFDMLSNFCADSSL